jgi:hypothetical protein
MKGLLKLSTVALSAAMVAGMSTPVFAAGANVGAAAGTKISVTDANGNVVATTDANVKTYSFSGNGGEKGVKIINLGLTNGGVKKLKATTNDGTAVKWAYDSDEIKKAGKTLEDAKKAVTLSDDGTITVTKDAEASDWTNKTIDLLAYVDSSVKDDGSGELKDENYVTVKVTVDKPAVAIEYANADSVYTLGDGVNFGSYIIGDNATKDKLPEASHSSQELANASNAVINANHVATGGSAKFTISTGDESDYNTLVKYDYKYSDKVSTETKDFSKSIKAATTDSKLEGTVSVVGTVSGNGVTAFKAELGNAVSDYLFVVADGSSVKPVYRVYNPNSGEHFYTTTAKEVKALVDAGWQLEKIGWLSPSTGAEVYRVYNKNSGEHHYTTSEKEKNALVAAGWKDEGVAFYSATKNYTPVYREYNKNAFAFNHNYTTSLSENNMLVAVGWKFEGTAFYALGDVEVPKNSTEYAVAADQLEKDLNK